MKHVNKDENIVNELKTTLVWGTTVYNNPGALGAFHCLELLQDRMLGTTANALVDCTRVSMNPSWSLLVSRNLEENFSRMLQRPSGANCSAWSLAAPKEQL